MRTTVAIVLALALTLASCQHHGASSGPASRSGPSQEYPGLNETHRVQSRADDGRTVTLDDGSVWEIHHLDALDVAYWPASVEVVPAPSSMAIYGFDYRLTRGDRSVLARLLKF